MDRKTVSLGLLVLALVVSQADALSLQINPAQDTHTIISNKNCGSNADFPITVQDLGSGGVLCWYVTTDNPTPTQLTPACLRPSMGAQTYNARVLMPNSGSKTITVQLECYDFYSIFSPNDRCQDSTTYSQAVANHYSGGRTDISPRYVDASCSLIQFSISPSTQSVQLYNGQQRDLQFNVVNGGDVDLTCSYSGQVGTGTIGTVRKASSQAFTIRAAAPSSGQGIQAQAGSIVCNDALSGRSSSQSFAVEVSYSQDPALTAIQSAQNAINSAKSQLQSAEQAIQTQTARGVDTTGSLGLLQSAKALMQQSQTALTSATTAKTNGDSTGAKTYGDQATSLANQASSMNGQILSKLEDEKSKFESETQEASNLISQAKSKISEAQSWIDRAESVVANATLLGMDTVSAKTQIANAKSSISNANSYLQQATGNFASKNYNLAKQNANNAVSNADSAKTLAVAAHSSLNDVVQKVSIVAGVLSDANSEIQRADQTYTKLTTVVRETRKYADVSSVESDINAQKAVIDQAKDFASQAQNRFKAGQQDQAIDAATKARDTAASARNRLDRIVEKLTNTIQDALAKSLDDAKKNIVDANSVIQASASTYGVSGDSIASAQDKLKQAQIDVQSAEAKITELKTSTGLAAFLDTSVSAVDAIKSTNDKSSDAKKEADAAKTGALTKVGVGAATAVGAAGAGFMWWRNRNKGKNKKDGKEPTEPQNKGEGKNTIEPEKIDKKDENKERAKVTKLEEKQQLHHCKKCGKEYSTTAKFCESCGAKLGKRSRAG